MTTGARAVERDLTAPQALLDKVDERCRALAATAVGRVFSVPAEDAEAALRSESRNGARYDTVLSFMCTPQVTSLEDYVAAIEQVLADEGWILMVEPVTARSGALHSLLAARRGSGSRRRSAGADVVAALWSGGLVVTDLYRREVPSAPAGWRRYVVLKARRATPRSEEP